MNYKLISDIMANLKYILPHEINKYNDKSYRYIFIDADICCQYQP